MLMEVACGCIVGMGINYLVIDDFLIKKGDNSKDKLGSENLAKDWFMVKNKKCFVL